MAKGFAAEQTLFYWLWWLGISDCKDLKYVYTDKGFIDILEMIPDMDNENEVLAKACGDCLTIIDIRKNASDIFSLRVNDIPVFRKDKGNDDGRSKLAWLTIKGACEFISNDKQAALQTYNEILSNEPNNVWALVYRAKIHASLGNKAAALADVSKRIELDNEEPDMAYEQKGDIYAMFGDVENEAVCRSEALGSRLDVFVDSLK